MTDQTKTKRKFTRAGNEKLPRGRPKTVDGRKVAIYMDDGSLAIAKSLGDGNVSEGIRQALFLALKHQPSTRAQEEA